jgi:hypothetical protein
MFGIVLAALGGFMVVKYKPGPPPTMKKAPVEVAAKAE